MKFLNIPLQRRSNAQSSGTEISSSEDDECLERSLPIKKHPKLPKIIPIPPLPRKKFINSEECSIIPKDLISKTLPKIQPIDTANELLCSICITNIARKKPRQLGILECGHSFCIGCINESSKFSNKCPYCRASFTTIKNGNSTMVVEEQQFENQENYEDEPCYVCGRNDDFDRLLVCDGCNFSCCHTYCDSRLRGRFPQSNWFCLDCQDQI